MSALRLSTAGGKTSDACSSELAHDANQVAAIEIATLADACDPGPGTIKPTMARLDSLCSKPRYPRRSSRRRRPSYGGDLGSRALHSHADGHDTLADRAMGASFPMPVGSKAPSSRIAPPVRVPSLLNACAAPRREASAQQPGSLKRRRQVQARLRDHPLRHCQRARAFRMLADLLDRHS